MIPSQDEIVQIVNRRNEPIDAVSRSVMRARGLIHRASYILVFNAADQLFLQKRTMIKDIYPGYWDIAAGGVVLAGESYENSAVRELGEELGVSAPLTFLCDHYSEHRENRVWGRVFSCRHEGPFVYQPEEVEYGTFCDLAQVIAFSAQEELTPDGIEIIQRLHEMFRYLSPR